MVRGFKIKMKSNKTKKSPTIMNEEWLTTEEAAAYLKVSKGTLLNMVWAKKIIPFKLGRRNRYLKSDLRLLIWS